MHIDEVYGTERADKLLNTVLDIRTFLEVRSWDTSAKAEIGKLQAAVSEIKDYLAAKKKELMYAELAFKSQPFFKRIFASQANLKRLRSELDRANRLLPENEDRRQQLALWIERTPDDAEQAKAILKELKQIKKELSTQKKEINASIRAITTEARVKNSQISNQFFVGSKYRQIQRIGVRSEKEKALAPHEAAKFDLEYQIIEVDAMINWIERIKLTESGK